MLLGFSNSRHHGHPLRDQQTPGLPNSIVHRESTPKLGATALWHLKLASNFIYEDRTPLHHGYPHRYVLVPAPWQNLLLNRHGNFYLGTISSSCYFSLKLSSRSQETLPEYLISIAQKQYMQ